MQLFLSEFGFDCGDYFWRLGVQLWIESSDDLAIAIVWQTSLEMQVGLLGAPSCGHVLDARGAVILPLIVNAGSDGWTRSSPQAPVPVIERQTDRRLGIGARAQTGTTGSQVASTLRSNTTLKNDLEDLRQSLESIPLDETVAQLLSLKTTIEASYSATSKLLGLTLTDYLR